MWQQNSVNVSVSLECYEVKPTRELYSAYLSLTVIGHCFSKSSEDVSYAAIAKFYRIFPLKLMVGGRFGLEDRMEG